MGTKEADNARRELEILKLTEKIKNLLPEVLKITGYRNELSLNATYGAKYAMYIDIKNAVIDTPQQFKMLYLQGFLNTLENLGEKAREGNTYFNAFSHYRDYEVVREWLHLFLERTYLRKYEELSKVRPTVEESVMWLGQENASYGILVTPRFLNGEWENDKSEIRRFKPKYWTIGHILQTGFVIPGKNAKIEFKNLEQYLIFFLETIVRNSGSQYEYEIAERYCNFVRKSDEPENIPLLIPELRYDGLQKKHKYRLDFTIVNPYNMTKVGFELSPWSTHGKLIGTKEKKQKDINSEALANFEHEMKKLKAYFRKYGITVLVFTDTDLSEPDILFDFIKEYLNVDEGRKQLEFHAIDELLNFKGK